MAARLRALAREAGTQDEIVQRSGVPKATLQRILAGKSDPGDRLPAIAEAVGSTEDYILKGDTLVDRIVEVPVTDIEVSAGPGRFSEYADTGERWPFPRQWVVDQFGEDADLGIVTVKGDSQEPELRDGDRVVVDLNSNRLSEGMHVVRLDDALLLKRIQVEGARIRLKSRNPSYEDIMVDLTTDQDRFAVIARAGWTLKRV